MEGGARPDRHLPLSPLRPGEGWSPGSPGGRGEVPIDPSAGRMKRRYSSPISQSRRGLWFDPFDARFYNPATV